ARHWRDKKSPHGEPNSVLFLGIRIAPDSPFLVTHLLLCEASNHYRVIFGKLIFDEGEDLLELDGGIFVGQSNPEFNGSIDIGLNHPGSSPETKPSTANRSLNIQTHPIKTNINVRSVAYFSV
ncbi:MAG: hypothetical protein O6934_02815, partial [SAR324 cluster bacterium]|nr:hypothetical protein [SAR324 cluster bacterium]